jgi:hypothetical protein
MGCPSTYPAKTDKKDEKAASEQKHTEKVEILDDLHARPTSVELLELGRMVAKEPQ